MWNSGLDEAQAGIKFAAFLFKTTKYWDMNAYQKRVQDGEHMYTCGGFILIFGKTNTVM